MTSRLIYTKVLSNDALNWAVARAEGYANSQSLLDQINIHCTVKYLSWAQAGPIIERECIELEAYPDAHYPSQRWIAHISTEDQDFHGEGETPIIAAMRCYTEMRFGRAIEVPEAVL